MDTDELTDAPINDYLSTASSHTDDALGDVTEAEVSWGASGSLFKGKGGILESPCILLPQAILSHECDVNSLGMAQKARTSDRGHVPSLGLATLDLPKLSQTDTTILTWKFREAIKTCKVIIQKTEPS